MPLTILSVAYPLAPVRVDTAGGAEQVLRQIDRALVSAGHRSLVVACAGSQAHGDLIAFDVQASYAPESLRRAELDARRAIDRTLLSTSVDLVHIHAVDFGYLLPRDGTPTLVTLHMPRPYYSPIDLRLQAPTLWLNCVSTSQARMFADVPSVIATIENGVPIDEDAQVPMHERSFALWLGRICPEKAVHTAIDAAAEARMPLVIAGRTFPYPEHIDYFESRIAPRLGPNCRFVGQVDDRCKRTLLRNACCLIVSSEANESSSLVAREALACGTPVVARNTPALVDLIDHGTTGFVVDRDADMGAAIAASIHLDPHACVRAAKARCDVREMTAQYLHLYETLLSEQPRRSLISLAS